MLYRYQKPLQEIYDEYLEKYKQIGVKPYPDRLLALLLLQEKDKYDPENLTNGKFYFKYQLQINEKINQVISEFKITKKEIIEYIELKGIYHTDESYEYNKIWFVFEKGFTSVIGTQRFYPSQTPEKAYAECYGSFYGEHYKEKTNTRSRTLARYKEKVRRKNGRKYN